MQNNDADLGSTRDYLPAESLDWRPDGSVPGRRTDPEDEQDELVWVANIGRFLLRERLGGGGSGRVFRAYDPRLDREVALKVLRTRSPEVRVMERFFREARAAARLDHPNIVPLYDAGRDDNRCWIAYHFVDGQTLSRLRDIHRFDPEEAVRVVRDLAEAIDHAHGRGVFHRDVKPSNVIVDRSGRARLTDFGLARRLDCDTSLTAEGAILGTPAYMSPEQAAGESRNADSRSDIFSLGVILFELLSGRRPPGISSDVYGRRVDPVGPSPSPRAFDARIPRALDRICRRALAGERRERYPEARDLADDLTHWLDSRRLAIQWRRAAVALAAGCAIGLNIPVPGRPGTNAGTVLVTQARAAIQK